MMNFYFFIFFTLVFILFFIFYFIFFIFQDSLEWCDFCLCRKCGGKNLGPESDPRSAGGKDGDGTGGQIVSSNLFLFFSLLVVCVEIVTNGGNDLYKQFYWIGCVCALFVLRDAYVRISTIFS